MSMPRPFSPPGSSSPRATSDAQDSSLLSCFRHQAAVTEYWPTQGASQQGRLVKVVCISIYRLYLLRKSHPHSSAESESDAVIRCFGASLDLPTILDIEFCSQQKTYVCLLPRRFELKWAHWITLWSRATGERKRRSVRACVDTVHPEQISQEQSISNQIRNLTVRPLVDVFDPC